MSVFNPQAGPQQHRENVHLFLTFNVPGGVTFFYESSEKHSSVLEIRPTHFDDLNHQSKQQQQH
jgi:hypothetical protein